MRRKNITIVCLTLALSGGGCVSQGDFDQLQTKFHKSQEQTIELRARIEERDARIDQIQKTSRIDPKLVREIKDVEAENVALRQKLADFESTLADIGTTIPLPADLDEALVQLAESHADLMTYDRNRGTVKLRSELTFSLGSVEIKPDASATLAKLAKILNSPVATNYEVRIVGHTDNVKIRRAATLKNHPTNWHLSVHRSISVKNELVRAGVPVSRMGVAGYGSHRPVAPNKAQGGNELNRRVEINLVPRTNHGPSLTAEAAAPAAPQAPVVPIAAPQPAEAIK